MHSENEFITGLPNFLILGAPRSGTTTIYQNLRSHPEVFMGPVKEPMFFILEGEKTPEYLALVPNAVTEWETYRRLFQGAGKAKAIGEASTFYLFSKKAASRIRHRIRSAKFIAILRNPADRAFSHFLHNRIEGIEPLENFLEALEAEEERRRKGWFMYYYYRDAGFYGKQINCYFSKFSKDQFLFLSFDELTKSPDTMYKKIFRFLGVYDSIRIPRQIRYNPSGTPKNRRWSEFLRKPNPIKNIFKQFLPQTIQYNLFTKLNGWNLSKPVLQENIRRELIEEYRNDIVETQKLTGLDLSSWLLE
ncbi:MAG: sulfotransferase [Anaerolineales bacterium]|nr:sulfotransferase [Anaerolineales bacterium]